MATVTSPSIPIDTQKTPPLENGDRLTRDEFERRYDAMPHLKKAELIEGVVYVPSPVRFEEHGGPHFDLIGWLAMYRMVTPGVRGGDNATLRLDMENEPQPDAFLIVLPEHGGQARIDDEGYIVGAPELVAQVAASSVSYDLHVKLNAYRRNGVKEYIVWRIFDRAIDWFILREDRYEAMPLTPAGLYRSKAYPGLWLDPSALIKGDLPVVAQAAQQGIASAEHAAFVNRLRRAAVPGQP